MPTTVSSTVGTGGDYSSWSAWHASIDADLVASDEIHEGLQLDETLTAAVTIDGHTTDATRYIRMATSGTASFADKAGVRTTALRYNTANGAAIEGNIALTLSDNYTRVRGLQFRNNSGYFTAIDIAAAVTNCRVEDFIAKNGTGSGRCVISRHASNVFANGLIECPSAGNGGWMTQGECRNVTIVCTAASPTGTGFESGYSAGKAVNCAVFGFSTSYNGTAASGSGFNATDQAATFGTDCLQSLTYADQFESSSNDFRAKSTGALQAGTPDSTWAPDDISGQTRNATTPWIGCWEVAGGAATTRPPRQFRSPVSNYIPIWSANNLC